MVDSAGTLCKPEASITSNPLERRRVAGRTLTLHKSIFVVAASQAYRVEVAASHTLNPGSGAPPFVTLQYVPLRDEQ